MDIKHHQLQGKNIHIKIMRYHFTPVRMASIKGQRQMLVRRWKKAPLYSLLVGIHISTLICIAMWRSPRTVKIELLYDCASYWRWIQKELNWTCQRDIALLTTTLVMSAKIWKWTKCLLLYQWPWKRGLYTAWTI